MADIAFLIARVTARVHAPATQAGEDAVLIAVGAAIDYVDTVNGFDSLASTSPMVAAGLEGFATRLYMDPSAPFGGVGVAGDFDLHATEWGFA